MSQNKQIKSNIIRQGSSHSLWHDPYHLLLTIDWYWFLGLIGLAYIMTNALFALLYLAGGDCIQNARHGYFWDAFFFSVQTMASIGYGAMYPLRECTYTNILVTIESITGLMVLTVATGLMFARFSRPTAKVLFSRVAVISPYNGVPTLMFRTANQRHNQILQAELQVTLVRNQVTLEGEFMRRFYDLKLVRSQSLVFALTWTAMHQIDRGSPLYGATAESLAQMEAEIVIMLTGIDDTVSQAIHARYSYMAEELLWNHRFVDILVRKGDGGSVIDYTRFHDVRES
ncbi:ion channel [Limnofasciculus baicalensis]|uniref:Ion channel n=1 Tax=Limnofasciculus baicalensis BBK-W-15 TaxID=2699891 RepID=A0AAE3GV10_9CYAN|nr:ion channel [Limnofasciculus baicalensis]MCP2730293.1 ion channel [Limnofasciculus baicalensis BBK-W-15]